MITTGSKLAVVGRSGRSARSAWWHSFHSQAGQFLGSKASPPEECLHQDAGPCRLITTAASWVSMTPYDPRALFASLAILGLGVVLRFVEAIRAATEPPPMGMGDTRHGRTRDFR